ncbi:amino acid ABC transporter permease [Labrys wisconsinensis]|uniref:Polar amino acid transport system permease protein n=1 Tax=Labrys wisconsinensis TaxID=425677 RepID=A0ABU0JHG5_9HYPH|nr:amino acid ABC transporter permease [Labrys wisconsinensis]MDQ0473040.1 polar amino acid transport system permease protein [Labrys wisconsinensis]
MTSFFQPILANLHDWGPQLVKASGTTILLTLLGFAAAFALGLAVEFLRTRRSPLVRRLVDGYLLILRGVPILVVLYLLYFALPGIGVTLPALVAGVLGLGLVYSAYLAEVFRAGLQSVPRGQREAALAAGLTPAQTFRLVLFPQAVRAVLPPLLISLVSLLKDSSICALITVPELTLTSRAIMSESFLPLQIFALTGLFYFIIAWPASLAVRALERRLQRGRAPGRRPARPSRMATGAVTLASDK